MLSCEVEFMDNRRNQFTGKLVDENNVPVSGASVSLEVIVPGFKADGILKIGEDITNAQGDYNFLALQPENKVMYLDISNYSVNPRFNIRLSQTITTSDDPLYDFGELEIRKPRIFRVIFENSSGSEEQIFYEYTYTTFSPLNSVPEGWQLVAGNYTRIEPSEEISLNGSLVQSSQREIELTTLLGTTLEFRYSIGEPLYTSENVEEINLIISQNETEYEIEY